MESHAKLSLPQSEAAGPAAGFRQPLPAALAAFFPPVGCAPCRGTSTVGPTAAALMPSEIFGPVDSYGRRPARAKMRFDQGLRSIFDLNYTRPGWDTRRGRVLPCGDGEHPKIKRAAPMMSLDFVCRR
jgi:hypothetical protein